MNVKFPSGAGFIIDRLKEHGYDAYFVGGCVRDALMGRECCDWDITTSAHPDRVCEIFASYKVIRTGIVHGTVTVMIDGQGYEVTTFRADGEYKDHRHPDSVIYAGRVEDDLSRRDFTVNSMAYNEQTGTVDLFGGQSDIDNKLIRAVGDPCKRFEEDALRILRGLRFASQLGFDIEPGTADAMRKCRGLIRCVSGERIYQEICKLIMGDNALKVMLEYADIIAVAVPEIAPAVGFDQRNKHHIYTVWDHTAYAVANSPKDLICRLVMLLHDSAKPDTFTVDAKGTGHFYGHAVLSAQKAERFFERSGERSSIRNRVCRLIHLHDSDLFSGERSIKRWLSKLGEDDLLRLIDIKKADSSAQAPEYRNRLSELEKTRTKVNDIIGQKPCVTKSMLAVNGNEIMAVGASGEQIGRVLDLLMDAVIDNRCENTKNALLNYADTLIKQD